MRINETGVKRIRAREEIRTLTQRREKEIFLARSVFLRCLFLLAQEGVPFLCCICDEHEQYCNQCYGKKYFHAPRIARNVKPAFCNELTTAKQICKALMAGNMF
jgi:hypothetical protein